MAFQYLRPSSDVSIGAWYRDPAGGGLYTAIDESGSVDGEVAKCDSAPFAGDPDFPYTFGLSAGTDPLRDTGHTLRIWADAAPAGGAFSFALLQSGSLIASSSYALTSGADVEMFELVLSSAEAASITDYTALQGRVTLLHDGTSWALLVDKVEFEIPSPFAHLDVSGSGLLEVTAASGHYLEASGSGLIQVAGGEGPGSLIVPSGTGLKVAS